LLPGFREGAVSVQDAGAQLAAKLLDAQPRMRVMDACAAPGGKTGHLLEHTPDLAELVAIDVDAARVARIQENLERLGRKALVQAADVRDPATFWDGRPFDRILVDAPCSSTGVIRRHPDIKLLRRATDIPSFVAVQERILRSAFSMLASGGRLVYCTCSLVPAENEDVVERLLATEPSARVAAMPPATALAPGAQDRRVGIQLIPGSQAGSDGFYYACLEKTTAGT
jgi:16S rRNA (cytosine967-C5)-methyltransferase